MFKTDILFTGFYGQSNTGDDAFVEVASWGAKNYWKKFNNRFLAVEGKLPKTLIESKGYPLSIPKTYRKQSEFLLNRTKAFIYAGGSTIHSKIAEDNIRMSAFRRKMTTDSIKIGGIGVSVGPFRSSSDEQAVKRYLTQMDFLAVRDQASFDFVNSLNLPYKPVNAFDLAALLPEIYNYNTKNKRDDLKKNIAISVCPYESLQYGMNTANEDRRNQMMVELIKELDREGGIHFKFYIINGDGKIGDRKLTIETVEKSSPSSFEVINYSPVTHDVWRSIADCDFVISTRLHAAIFACFSNTPFMLNEYHRKCTDFLCNIAYDDRYRLFDSQCDVREKASQILEIVNGNKSYHFPERVEEMKYRAKLNFTQINL